MAEFTFALSSAKQVTVSPRVKVAQFGDGYAQRVQDGLNAQPEQWSLSLDNRPAAQVADVVAFLSSHGGHTPFTWRGKKWVCPSWSRQEHGRGIESVSFNIEQDFSL